MYTKPLTLEEERIEWENWRREGEQKDQEAEMKLWAQEPYD